MKKGIINLLILITFIGSIFIGQNAVLADNTEIIRSFQTNILVKENSDVEIQETIIYDFGSNQKHGIFRQIPFKYPLEDKTLVLNYEVLKVQNEHGKSIEYQVYKEGNNFVIKIGSANKLISGQNTYIIKYVLKGIINYFDEHDELFLNITGNDWQIPIEHIEAHFAIDNFFNTLSIKDDFKTKCYTGVSGSQEENCLIDKALSAKVISFTASNLKPKEGLTIVIGWPKGFVQEVEKKYTQTKIESAILNKIILVFLYTLLFIPVLIFGFLSSMWWKKGRNPRSLKSIMAEYEAPADISPSEAHIILTETSLNLGKMATATLIDLARRGYFIIQEEEKKTLIFKSTDWKFIKTDKQKPEDVLNKYEKYLLDNIFEGKNEVSLSQLKNASSHSKQTKMKTELDQAKISLGKNLTNKNLFSENPFALIKKLKDWQSIIIIFYIAICFIVLPFILLKFDKFFFLSIFSTFGGLLINMIIFSIFIKIMPSLTEQGMQMKEKIKGFELFLKTVERDRVKFHFSPEAHPEKFAEYLPYAILFGVEKQWANLFKNIVAAIPDWYQGTQGTSFNSIIMVSRMQAINTALNSSFVATGHTAASGQSGFGGSSGGGFGGGGGGSW